MFTRITIGFSKLGLLCALTAAVPNTHAQEALEEVLVTGYRGSLLNSTNAKRNSVGFSDEVFADDIGKMPSQNLAESLSRIPGVIISREVTGEGQQIQVRGLGSSFTKVVMNGNAIAVASDGSLGSGARGRHTDLDMFPAELFSSLSVNKTSTAQQIEGGVSGYVNMRTLRASDLGEGANVRFSLEGAYNDMSGATSPKASFLWGNSGDRFGILLGAVAKQHESRVDGYETVGNYQSGCHAHWYDGVVDANDVTAGLAADPPEVLTEGDSLGRLNDCVGNTHGRSGYHDSSGWNVFHYTDIASADYAAAHPGVSVGDQLDINAVSGLSDEQLDNFGLPYIARSMYTMGDRDSASAIVALEYNPNDDMAFTLDILHSRADRNFLRNEAIPIFRRNYIPNGLEWILEDITLSEDNIIQSGTFYNSSVWVGSHLYEEELTYTSVMPKLSWQLSDEFLMDVSASKTDSSFTRDDPYFFYYSEKGSFYFDYGTEYPTYQHSVDLASASGDWTFRAGPGTEGEEYKNNEFRFQRNARDTETTAFHLDFSLGEDPGVNGLKFGLAWDEIAADMQGFSGGDAWSELVTGADVSTRDYLVDSPITDFGSSIDGYAGNITGIASLDWDAMKERLNYDSFEPLTVGGGDAFGQSIGNISEQMLALYLEANSESEIADRTLRTNMGVRLVDTEQTVSTIDASTVADYSRILPSFSAVYDLSESIKFRTSASRSLTRANPSNMFPEVAWNGSGIDRIEAGNPFLNPFESTNFDIGGEWYFSDLGYVGLTYYEKDIVGFTREDNIQVQFLELANYGVDIGENDLGVTQRDALGACGGRNSGDCVTTVTTNVNIEGNVKLSGIEAIWVMPLDMLVEGLGFNASMNNINQKASDPEAEINGISDSVNVTAYYENESFQTRLTYYRTDATEATGGWSPLYAATRAQVDFTASYNLPIFEDYDLALTFDAYNITNEPLRSYFQSDGNSFNIFYPGATYTLGIRGQF